MWEFWIKPKDLRLHGSSVQVIEIKGNVLKSFIVALQLQDCARIVRSWTRPAFPIENVRKIINPSPIDQSKLQWDYKRISDPATIHWIWNQILGTRFFFNPDRIGLIIWQSTKNVAIRLQFQINPNLTAHRQVLGLESRAGSYPCPNPIFRILKSCRNRGSHFLQFTGLWLNCGKSTTLIQLRSIKFDCVEIAPQLVTVRGHPTKLQTHPVQLGQIANRRPIDHRRIVWNF